MTFSDKIQLGILLATVSTLLGSKYSDRKQQRLNMFAEYTKRCQYIIMDMPNNFYIVCIRPLANERKNSLSLGSHKKERVTAVYHSIVSTCKLQGYSILEYLKKFFAEIVADNRDYRQLMPSTIGISANKL